MVKKLQRADGTMTADATEMEHMATNFYRDLFTSEGTANMQRVIDTVPRKVSQEMNDSLTAEYTPEEIKNALFQIVLSSHRRPMDIPRTSFRDIGSCVGQMSRLLF